MPEALEEESGHCAAHDLAECVEVVAEPVFDGEAKSALCRHAGLREQLADLRSKHHPSGREVGRGQQPALTVDGERDRDRP